ncbi:MAG: ECF-type sigma factor [Rhodothermales bacterium]
MNASGATPVKVTRESISDKDGTITRALARASSGDDEAFSDVVQMAYDELSALARSYLRRERDDHTLDTCALVHEAYARLVGQKGVVWQNRRHFYGIAAQHMRRILCDYARQYRAEKRGGGCKPIRLHGLEDLVVQGGVGARLDEVLTFEQILRRLERHDTEALEIVHLRCILGFKMTEISRETGIPMRTLSRKWRWAKAWLVAELLVVESQPPM